LECSRRRKTKPGRTGAARGAPGAENRSDDSEGGSGDVWQSCDCGEPRPDSGPPSGRKPESKPARTGSAS